MLQVSGPLKYQQTIIGMSSLVVFEDIDLDAVSRQFESYLTIAGSVCMLVAPLWCDLVCGSRTVAIQVISHGKAAAKPAFSTSIS